MLPRIISQSLLAMKGSTVFTMSRKDEMVLEAWLMVTEGPVLKADVASIRNLLCKASAQAP